MCLEFPKNEKYAIYLIGIFTMILNISSSSFGVYFPTSYSTIVYPQLLKFLRLFNKWIIIYLNVLMPPSSARISFKALIAFWITNGSGSLIILYKLSIISLSFFLKKNKPKIIFKIALLPHFWISSILLLIASGFM